MVVARLGDNRFLLSVPYLEEVLPMMENLDFELRKLFISLERWVPGSTSVLMKVWVCCYGIPLHGLNVKVFEKIGKRLRKVVGVAKETLERLNLEYGRICLQLSSFHSNNKVVWLEVFGLCHSLTVKLEDSSPIVGKAP